MMDYVISSVKLCLVIIEEPHCISPIYYLCDTVHRAVQGGCYKFFINSSLLCRLFIEMQYLNNISETR